jgi:hypothetical protein
LINIHFFGDNEVTGYHRLLFFGWWFRTSGPHLYGIVQGSLGDIVARILHVTFVTKKFVAVRNELMFGNDLMSVLLHVSQWNLTINKTAESEGEETSAILGFQYQAR